MHSSSPNFIFLPLPHYFPAIYLYSFRTCSFFNSSSTTGNFARTSYHLDISVDLAVNVFIAREEEQLRDFQSEKVLSSSSAKETDNGSPEWLFILAWSLGDHLAPPVATASLFSLLERDIFSISRFSASTTGRVFWLHL